MIADGVETNRVCMGDRVLIVHAVNLGCLEQAVSIDLACSQRSSGIGGEIWVAGASCKNDDIALFEMMHRTTTNVGLADLVHLNSAHNAARAVLMLKGVLKREGVHHRGEHAHIVCLSAIHALGGTSEATEDVTATDNNTDLDAVFMN